MPQTAFIVVLSHELFQGCTLLIEGDAARMDLSAQERLIHSRMREKLGQGFMSMGLEHLAEHVHALSIHLHSPLELGVVNWACSHRHVCVNDDSN